MSERLPPTNTELRGQQDRITVNQGLMACGVMMSADLTREFASRGEVLPATSGGLALLAASVGMIYAGSLRRGISRELDVRNNKKNNPASYDIFLPKQNP